MTPEATWRNRIVGTAEVAPGELVANPLNWRKHPKAQREALAGALDTIGWVQQVLVNRRTGRMVDGHARVEEALARSEPTVPVLYVDLSDEEERLVLATLDPIGALADTDGAKLEALLADVVVDDARLVQFLASGRPHAGLADPDDVPDLPGDTYVKRGDLWVLGPHRVMCGDSTDAGDVARLAAGSVADCIWTDPPYGVAYEGKTAQRLRIENDDPTTADAVIAQAFAGAPLGPSAPFYVSAPAGPRGSAFRAAIEAAGWRLHQELVWFKGTIVLGHSDYHYSHEPIFYGYGPGPGRPGRGRHPGSRWHGDHAQSSVLEYPKPAANRLHPTMKPVALIAHCLRNSTAPGDLVYDPFCGSGTTIIAAEEIGRRGFAMELDPRYVQVAIDRWQAFTGLEAVRG